MQLCDERIKKTLEWKLKLFNNIIIMNSNQKLRFLINEYWTRIDIDDLYTQYKSNVLKIKKGSELAENKKEKLIGEFKYGLQELDNGIISKEDAKHYMTKKLFRSL